MSYDLKIYTIQKQNFNDLINRFNILLNKNGFVLQLKNHQIVVSDETHIEDEDIPQSVGRELPGIKYLIECSIEPTTSNDKIIKELLKLSRVIAKNGVGVIENPQTDEIILPSGVKRVQPIEKTERFSLIELSWWFNHNNLSKQDNINLLLRTIEKNIPEALPRRYGLYEPPKEKFTTLDSFSNYLVENANESVVWYPTKPVDYVNFSIPEVIGPMRVGYRFGHFSISIDAAVLKMPGWNTAIERLFINISEVIQPFYGDIRILKNNIRSRSVSYSDFETDRHPIVSWWWNGIPREFGLGLVLGNPLLGFLNMKGNHIVLSNGCQLILDFSDEDDNKEINKFIAIPEGLFQPNRATNKSVIGFSGQYPKIWPFDGPCSI